MKQLYLVILTVFSFSQINAQNTAYVVDQMKAQARQEQERFARLNGLQQNMQMRTVASANFDVKHYRCEWEIDPAVRFITGKVTSTFITVSSAASITFDLNNTLTVDSVVYHGTKINFAHNTDKSLVLTFPSAIPAGQKDSVSVFYKGIPENNGSGSFVTSAHGAGVPVLWTLSEPYGARDWWPCKNGLDDKTDSIDLIITCPVAYRTSANGVLFSEQTSATKRISWYKHRYPIASYLVAMACTDYVVRNYNVNINGRNLLFQNWTYPEGDIRFDAEAYGVQNALVWFSNYFGDYPFMNERYAQTQWHAGGGMEHQTNTFLNVPQHLLQAHELGHQWFGDKNTCGSWQHIWVNEGFASFAHWLYFATHDPPTYYGIRYEYHQTVVDEPNGSVFVRDTANEGRIFDWRLSYVKGSYVLHMLRGMLGDTKFFQAMKQYSEDPKVKYGFARTEDVQRNFEQVSGKNLNEFFKDWIYGEGHPKHTVYWYQNNNGWLTVQVNQRQSNSSVSFFELPLQVRFKNATRDSLVTLDLQRNDQLFYLNLGFLPDTVEIDPDLWILSSNDISVKLNRPPGSDGIRVFPNPATQGNAWGFTITNPSGSEYMAELYSTSGQLLYRKKYTTTGSDLIGEIPNQLLPAGIYQLRISNSGNTLETKKIIKL